MKLYASNLSYNTGDAELNDLFASYGQVTSAIVITDKFTGKSRGFGFVEMPSEEEANASIKSLNNKEVEGRSMSVSVAREKTDRMSSGGGGFNRNSFGKKW